MRRFTLLLLLVALVVWMGCEITSNDNPQPDPAQPDLVLLNNPTDGGGAYCRRTRDQLTVQVHNQGDGATTQEATVSVRVEFAGAAGLTKNRNVTLQPGATIEFVYAIPAACYTEEDPCEFSISVDSTNVIAESNENNNTAGGTCYDFI